MSGPDFTVDADGPRTLGDRIGDAMGAVRGWAVTEVGGWIIVGVLATAAVVAALALLVQPRLQPGPDVSGPGAPAAGLVAQAPGAGPADFTLAPEELQDFSHDQARAWNANLPFSTDPIRPASPLIAPTTDIEAYGRALDCLTAAIYYEAASETPQGQAAVAQVVLNRARHPAYPRSVCGVVFQGSERTTGCQFSFTCDGAMARVPSTAGWARARAVASAALNGSVASSVGTATHYHTDWVAPYWAPRLTKLAKIGTHIFYRWNGAWGLPSAFSGVYSGIEPVVPKMIGLTTIVAEAPAEIMAFAPMDPIVSDVPEARIIAALPLSSATEMHEMSVTPDQTAEVMAPSVPVKAAPVVQRDVPIMADPLRNPTQPTRQRQRIAAPSGW